MSYDFDPQEFKAAKQSMVALALALQKQTLTACENVNAAERFFEFICQQSEPVPEARCPPRDKIFGVNIEEEYALIKQGKSKLSRKMRDLVIGNAVSGKGRK